MKKLLPATFLFCLAQAGLAFPGFDPFTSATSSGGTSYTAGAALYHQTNALGEGWALWNGGSGSSSAEVSCVSTGLSYSGFPANFPPPPAANSVSLPGTSVNASGYSAALQFSRAVSADPNNLVTNKIFASFLMQIPSLGNLDSGAPIYFGGFATNTGDQSISLPGKALKIYLKGNNSTAGSSTSYSIGIQNATGSSTAATFDSGGHTTGSVLFVVVDYEFGINGEPDLANLWVNPSASSFGATTPPAPSATISINSGNSGQLITAADFFLLSRNGASIWGSLLVADLRAADTWCYVTGGPEIIASPTGLTNNPGTPATFTVQAVASATNVNPLSYQWRFNGANLGNTTNISGVTTPSLTINSSGPTNAGTYSVLVANAIASLTNSASLTLSGISLLTNPVSQTVLPGASASFTVAAAGTAPFTYQWLENRTNLGDGPGATGTVFSGSHTNILQLANISEDDNAAVFTCAVTNGVGVSVVSSGATLTVGDPIFLSNPQNATVQPGGTANFIATAFGSAPLSFQWQKNGVNLANGVAPSGATISGVNTTNLVISGAGYSDGGGYSLSVINSHGATATSSFAYLNIFVSNPTNQIDDLNVASYGAVGDGVTDDTAAFNAAIAAAQSGNHSGVYIPMGRYVITSTLVLNAVELVGNFAGGWPADNLPLPTLLIHQYTLPAVTLTNGASISGLAINYDEQTPSTTNAPAISLLGNGLDVESVRIQNAYDAISTPAADQPGRLRLSDILIVQPAHVGVQISKCYDFVQYKHIEVVCPGTMSTGPAFSFGRVDEGGYTGLVASNCAIGIQFYLDTQSGGGDFTGSFAVCSFLNCSNGIVSTGDHKIKITACDFESIASDAVISGTNQELTLTGDKFVADSGQAVQVQQAANFIAEGCIFARPAPASTPLLQINNSTTATVNACQFLPGSTGLELDSLLYRAVIVDNSFEDGGVSNFMTSTKYVIANNLTIKSPPQNVVAVPGNAQIALSWSASLNASSYNVQRSLVSGGPYTTIASPTATAYTNSNVTNGTIYYYVVSAIESGVATANSVEVNATPQAAPPVILTATPGNAQVTLTWSSVTGASSYNIGSSTVSGGPYNSVGSTAITSFANTGLTNGITYYYIVVALTSSGPTAYSAQASATPEIPAPSAPTGLMATATNGEISLSWLPSAGATGYYIFRALSSGGPYALIGTTPLAAWADTLVQNGTTYFYVVIADNATGASADSSQASALPQIVVDLSLALAPGSHQFTLSWPGWATNFQLLAAPAVSPSASWLPVTNSPQSNNGFFMLTLSVTNNQQFFRLNPP